MGRLRQFSLSNEDCKAIIDALEFSRRDTLNCLDYSGAVRGGDMEVYEDEERINRKYDRLIAKVRGKVAGKVGVEAAGRGTEA